MILLRQSVNKLRKKQCELVKNTNLALYNPKLTTESSHNLHKGRL